LASVGADGDCVVGEADITGPEWDVLTEPNPPTDYPHSARLYAWRERADAFVDGRVHAKVAVADGSTCFITSANLTGYAMDRNMEAGLLVSGGHVPRLLEQHLQSLVDTKVVASI